MKHTKVDDACLEDSWWQLLLYISTNAWGLGTPNNISLQKNLKKQKKQKIWG